MSHAWYFLDLFGSAVFAFSGALSARQKKMDIFGISVIAFVTAVGGGTYRDLLLGRKVFWLSDNNYILIALIMALLVFIMSHRHINEGRFLLVAADAMGLGIFTVIGAERAIVSGAGSIGVIFMATLTGIGGGITRDVLCGRDPVVLHREVYAINAMGGAALFLVLHKLCVPLAVNAAVVAIAVFLARIACRLLNISLQRKVSISK